MSKLEKEVKILGVDKNRLKSTLEEIGAEKVEESLQKIYVYDLPSIYARFYDCILQLKQCKKPYEFQVCRNKLQGILMEVDNLTTDKEQEELEQENSSKFLETILNRTENESLLETFSNNAIISTIKKYGINPNKWVRLRNTNGKTTITIKHILNPKIQEKSGSSIQKVIETEMEVPSIEEGNSILEQLGFSFRNYQEKERVTYNVNGVEVNIDSWPLIPTYVEIENDSEDIIFDTVKKLELEGHEIVSCNTAEIYNKYGIDLYSYRKLKFSKKENEVER